MFNQPKRFGLGELSITPREDPGEPTIGTVTWITAQVFGTAAPYNMDTARSTADAFRRTLDYINRLPEGKSRHE